MNSAASIRRAGPDDAAALAAVGTATFLESYAGVIDGRAIVRHCAERQSAQAHAAALGAPGHALWLAEVEPAAAPVGYLHLSPPDLPIVTRPGDLEIKRIYALSRWRGRGIGARLLAEAERYARAAGAERLLLGVYKGNALALGFYDRVGFTRAGERLFDVGGAVYEDWVLEKPL